MSETEKMYELAEIKPVQNMYRGEDDENWILGYFCDILYNALPENEKVKIKVKPLYPPFTAEKQLELIKWLGKNKGDYGLQYRGSVWCNCCDFCWEYFDKASEDKNFEKSLAGLINILWQDLTEEERKQIKEILE